MALYVTSDSHGHVAALDEALSRASIGSGDELYVLGDMIDRGPDPLGVVRLVRALPNAHVLMGNHEQLMVNALADSSTPDTPDADSSPDWAGWMLNGGDVTSAQLENLSDDELCELCEWVRTLPLFATAQAGGRTYALVHAGINPVAAQAWLAAHAGIDPANPDELAELLGAQDSDDLLWVRDAFWGCPTGLVGTDGAGPVVVAGHTPSPYLGLYVGDPDLTCTTEDDHGMIVELGACAATGYVADKIDIDCAAAGGFGMGRVGVLRLDDHATWYASVHEGE